MRNGKTSYSLKMPPKNRPRDEDATKMMVDAMKNLELSEEQVYEKIATGLLDGGDPNAVIDDETTLLLSAIERNFPSCVDALLHCGADPNKDHGDTTPLDHVFFTAADENQVLNLVRRLLLAKAKPNNFELKMCVSTDYHSVTRLLMPKVADGWSTLLHVASILQSEELIDLALELLPTEADEQQDLARALAAALTQKNTAIVDKILSAKGILIDMNGPIIVSSLSIAAANGDAESVNKLLDVPNRSITSQRFDSSKFDNAFLSAVQSGSLETVKVLLAHARSLRGGITGWTQFLGMRYATRFGKFEMFNQLIELSAEGEPLFVFVLIRDIISRNDEMTANAMLMVWLSSKKPQSSKRNLLESFLSKVPGKEKLKEKIWKWFRGEEWRDSEFLVKKEENDDY
jgi:hypothetical protein